MKKLHFLLGIGILIIPVIIFYMLNVGKPQYMKLPIYGEKVYPDGKDVKDTIYYQVPDFKVANQYGDSISQANLNDGIFLANFFFASCKDVCPSMNRRIKLIYDDLQELAEKNKLLAEKKGLKTVQTPVRFISFTVDPDHDSVAVLAAYAKRFNITGHNWYFTTGGKEAIFNIGRGFLLPVSIEDRTIDHSQQLLLIDKQNRIRGIYNALDDADMKRLQGEIKVLLYEYSNQQ